jgi:glycosyltransferase involved in cell wall biosynthesis
VTAGSDRPQLEDQFILAGASVADPAAATRQLVSILIPAYNAERWIAATLQSALAQTWRRKEIIVVDDGSRDGTLAVARKFEPLGVRVATQIHQGAAAARNRAFSLSHGEYIQWLDADDLLSPDKIELQLRAAEKLSDPGILLSCAWGRFMHRPHGAKFVPSALWADLTPADWLVASMGQNLYMPPMTWLTSRSLAIAAGPWNTEMHVDDDGEYFCRVLAASSGVRFVPQAAGYYRATGSGSLSNIGTSDRKLAALWKSMQLHVRCLLSLEDSARTRAACFQYLQDWLGSFYPLRMDIVEQARDLAQSCGGSLQLPQFPPKYAWIDKLLGPRAARHAQVVAPPIRWAIDRFRDRLRFAWENRDAQASRGKSLSGTTQN